MEYRKRADGLGNLFAFGFRGPVLQAILQRVAKLSEPLGTEDDRTADQRRFDALSDMLLGRVRSCAGGGATCGCRPGEGAPCGADRAARWADTSWGRDLHDPYLWAEPAV